MLPLFRSQVFSDPPLHRRQSRWSRQRVVFSIILAILVTLCLSIILSQRYTDTYSLSQGSYYNPTSSPLFSSTSSPTQTAREDTVTTTTPAASTSFASHLDLGSQLRPENADPEAIHLEGIESKYAFATFLAGSDQELAYEDDKYLIATRILAYQLLHAEATRSRDREIPFIVLVTDKVRLAARERLRKDGAIVLRVPGLNTDWLRPNRQSWQGVMTKLRLWELVGFERIAFLDADHVLVEHLDGVSLDPAAEQQHTLPIDVQFPGGQLSIPPDSYVFAGNAEGKFGHHYPPTEDGRDWRVDFLNAGFFVTKPDLALLRYYMSVMKIPNAFKSGEPEQNLFNAVHARNGSMPWRQLSTDFDVHYPNLGNIWAGVKSVHEKWWAGEPDQTALVRGEIGRDPRETHLLGPWMEGWRWRMERYFNSADEVVYKS